MGFSYWLRVGMMTVALFAVILLMRNLNQTHRPGQSHGFFSSLFGSGNTAGVNLCPTRVTRLEAGRVTLFQDGMQWVRENGATKQPLDNVAVEKWFSTYCMQSGAKTSASADVHAALKVFFVSGEPQTLLQSAGGEYEWMGQPFRSTKMDEALKELGDLPPSTERK
jgi:hypothetical protein